MLMPNCLFRAGGAAMLLSNRRRDRWTAKCASFSLSLSLSFSAAAAAVLRAGGRAGQHNGEGSVARADPPPPHTIRSLPPRYELCHVVRTHIGANDSAYSCIFQQEDEARSRALFVGEGVGLGGLGNEFGVRRRV